MNSKANTLIPVAAGVVLTPLIVYLVIYALDTGNSEVLLIAPAIFAALAVLVNPLLGIAVVLFLSPIKTSGDEILLIAKLIGILVIGVVFIRVRFTRGDIRKTGMEAPLILMALGMSISFLRTTAISTVGYSLLSLASLYALALVLINLAPSEDDLRKLTLIFLGSGIYPIVQGLLEGAQGADPERVFTRVSGTFTIPTGLGGFLIPITILSLALLFYPGFLRLTRLFVLGVFGGGAAVLMLTLSRGAIFGAFFGFAIVVYILRAYILKRPLLMAGIAALFIVAMMLSWSSLMGRVFNPLIGLVTGGDTLVTVTQRVDEMSVLIPITLDTYFMGTGIGNYARAIVRYRILFDAPDLPGVPHNILLYFFAQAGIFAALGFFWLLLWLLRFMARAYRPMKLNSDSFLFFVYIGAMASLAGYVPFLISHSGLFSNEMWISAAFLISAVQLAQQTQTRSPERPSSERIANVG